MPDHVTTVRHTLGPLWTARCTCGWTRQVRKEAFGHDAAAQLAGWADRHEGEHR